MSLWSWRLASPARPGAVAIVELWGQVDRALESLEIPAVPRGSVALRTIPHIDTALVSRLSDTFLQIMPHGGPAVVRALAERLQALAGPASPIAPRPEAASALESAMLDTLARAASPAAIDLLLAQPARWASRAPNLSADHLHPGTPEPDDAILRRLIDPPLVVAWGAANIGKSSLCNALAGREAAIVADEPGTTRDHVGVVLDLDGLTVRYVDTPGVRAAADPLEREAARDAAHLAAHADLLLLCGDPSTPPPPLPSSPSNHAPSTLRVLLRSDLAGPDSTPIWQPDLATSVKLGSGFAELAQAIRERLVPSALYHADRPWRFWS
jgi:tRNA modification GTPase